MSIRAKKVHIPLKNLAPADMEESMKYKGPSFGPNQGVDQEAMENEKRGMSMGDIGVEKEGFVPDDFGGQTEYNDGNTQYGGGMTAYDGRTPNYMPQTPHAWNNTYDQQ
jgi:hypothetical protein